MHPRWIWLIVALGALTIAYLEFQSQTKKKTPLAPQEGDLVPIEILGH